VNIAMFFTEIPSRCIDTVVGYHCIKCDVDMFYELYADNSMPSETSEEEYMDTVRYLI